MKIHTNEYKNKIKLFGRQLDSKIRYELNGVTIELGTEELNSITPRYEGSILKSVMKQLDIDSNVVIPLDTVINYKFGLFVDRYYETEDENYQSNINYYNYTNNSYVLLNAGIDYNIGDSITGTVYNYQDWEYLDFGNYIVQKIERKEDTKSWQITCYDKMLYSMKKYENLGVTYPITIRNYLSALCNHLGLVFANSSDTFANYDKEIQNELYLDVDGNSLDYTFRDVLDELAQVTASTICINDEDKLEVRYLNNTQDTINEEYLKDVNVEFGEKYGPVNSIVISRASESDSVYLRDEESVAENGLCEIKISDNQILNFNDRSDYLEDILDQLNGLEYYVNDFSSTGITYYDLCDIYNIQVGNNTYKCIMLNDEINVSQGLVENVFTELLEQSETDYSKADKTDRKVNQTYLMVDKQNGRIDALASSVHDLTDFLKTVQGTGSITLENTTASNGAIGRLEITGITEIGLYPGMVYPSDKVYPSKLTSYIIIQENEDGTEHYETYIDLGFPLISTDKLIIENGKVSIKRVNSNINTNIEVILKTFEGETNISVKFFDNVNIKCEYIEKNEFTKYFATEAELSSSIIITDEQISSKVSKAEVISEINQSAEQIQINANKISLEGKAINLTSDNIIINSTNFSVDEDGKITGTAGDIAGFEIDGTDGFVYKIYAPYDYTNDDLLRIQGILMGEITPTEEDYTKYDLNNSGTIDSADYIRVLYYFREGITTSNYGKFEILLPKENKLMSARTGYINAYDQLVSGFNYNNLISENLSIRYEGNETIEARGSTGNITCVSLTQTSKEENKKNFEKYNNALETIKDTDIYKYHFKNQEDNEKKHIGFVIGKNFNYSNDITASDNEGNEIGADVYSMVSVCFQAIKEQQKAIEKLQEKISKLERKMNE